MTKGVSLTWRRVTDSVIEISDRHRWKKLAKKHWHNLESEKLAHKTCAKKINIVQQYQKGTKNAHKKGKNCMKNQKLAQLWKISTHGASAASTFPSLVTEGAKLNDFCNVGHWRVLKLYDWGKCWNQGQRGCDICNVMSSPPLFFVASNVTLAVDFSLSYWANIPNHLLSGTRRSHMSTCITSLNFSHSKRQICWSYETILDPNQPVKLLLWSLTNLTMLRVENNKTNNVIDGTWGKILGRVWNVEQMYSTKLRFTGYVCPEILNTTIGNN